MQVQSLVSYTNGTIEIKQFNLTKIPMILQYNMFTTSHDHGKNIN
jgi:hypothetical protein